MKQTSKILYSLFLLLTLIVPRALTVAQEPGLLPTNPFYFLKDIRRTAQSFFAVTPLRRAAVAVAVFDQKSGELLKTIKLKNSSIEAEALSIASWRAGLQDVAERLAAVSVNESAAHLWEETFTRAFSLFVSLEKMRGGASPENTIETAQMALSLFVYSHAHRASENEDETIATALEGAAADPLTSLRFIHYYRSAADGVSVSLASLYEEETIRLSGALIAAEEGADRKTEELLARLENPDELLFSLLILDELRDRGVTGNTRTNITHRRQSLITAAESRGEITRETLEALLSPLESHLAESPNADTRALFYGTQAQALFDEGALAPSFAQVVAAYRALQNAAVDARIRENPRAALEEAREAYDMLIRESRALTSETAARPGAIRAFLLLKEVEKKFAILTRTNTSSPDFSDALRELRIREEAVRLLLRNEG